MSKFAMLLAATSALGVVATAGAAQAQDEDPGFQAGSILIRARAVGVFPDVTSSVTPIGGNIAIGRDYIPEIDASYFFTPNVAVEAIAGTTRNKVEARQAAGGSVWDNLGNVWLLPPTVTAQWHFQPQGVVNPYLGAGLNYTFFYNAQNGSQNTGIKYDDHIGYAVQAGADIHLSGAWYANVDYKKIFLKTTATVNALGASAPPGIATTAKVNIDPELVGVGIGYRF